MPAFALMRHSSELEASFLGSSFFEQNHEFFLPLRSALGPLNFSAYRGIERSPFSEEAEFERWQMSRGKREESEPEARALIKTFLGPDDYTTPYPRSFLPQLIQANRVYSALKFPREYEIVELCVNNFFRCPIFIGIKCPLFNGFNPCPNGSFLKIVSLLYLSPPSV